jgi:hypothetical protein
VDLEAAAKRQLDLEAALMGATIAPPAGAAAELGREPSQPLQATLLFDPFVPSEPTNAVAHPASGGGAPAELPGGEPRAAAAGAPRVEASPPPQLQSPTVEAVEVSDDLAAMSTANLKALLSAVGVPHEHCIEKEELLALARSLAAAGGPALGSPAGQRSR